MGNREDLSEEVESLIGFSKRPQSGGRDRRIMASLMWDHRPRLERQLCLCRLEWGGVGCSGGPQAKVREARTAMPLCRSGEIFTLPVKKPVRSFLFCSFTFIGGGGGLGEPASSHVIRVQFVDAHFSTMWVAGLNSVYLVWWQSAFTN